MGTSTVRNVYSIEPDPISFENTLNIYFGIGYFNTLNGIRINADLDSMF